MQLVCLEEFNLDWPTLKEKAKAITSNALMAEEDEDD